MESQPRGHASLAKEIMAWLVCSERLMTIQELQHALAVETDQSKFDEENITLPSRLLLSALDS